MATLAQLESQIQKLQRRADALRQRESVEVIARIRAMMQEYELTTDDLAKAGSKAVKKRGRPHGSGNVSSAKKAAAKSKLPPKYRDPVSGATWSGHARPPAWIKDAPDRTVFLIDGATRTGKGAGRGRAATASRAAGAKKSAKRAGRSNAKKTARKTAQSTAV